MEASISGMYILKRRLSQLVTGYINTFSRFSYCEKMPRNSNIHPAKPPNVLVYHSNDEDVGYVSYSTDMVERCLHKERHVVYPLYCNRIQSDPWMDNCELLVIPKCYSNEKILCGHIEQFVNQGGKVLNFSVTLAESQGLKLAPLDISSDTMIDILSDRRIFQFTPVEAERLVSYQCSTNCISTLKCKFPGSESKIDVALEQLWPPSGCIVHCSIPLFQCWRINRTLIDDQSSLEILTCLLDKLGLHTEVSHGGTQHQIMQSFLLCSDPKLILKFLNDIKIMSSGSLLKGSSLTLDFVEHSKTNGRATVNKENCVQVVYSQDPEVFDQSMKFDWGKYHNSLVTERFGKVVLYSDIITSTMDVAEAVQGRLYDVNDFCCTCIARQQTKGKGRGGNKWLSPPGTAMMTISFSLPLRSSLGERLPILQHMMTVAVVHSIRSIPSFKDLELGVKWPNDIYFGSSTKIGGVLVRSTIFRENFIATIGCGVNVDNQYPTRCINDVIQATGSSVTFTCEEVLGLTISMLERLINEFQLKGPKPFMDLYYKYWIHSAQKVKVQLQDHRYIDAEIVGIDEYGFLLVNDHETDPTKANMITLQPDDNSFDMLKNMIMIKQT